MSRQHLLIAGTLMLASVVAVFYRHLSPASSSPFASVTSSPPSPASTNTPEGSMDAGSPEHIEIAPFRGEIFDSAGTRDFQNRLSSTVMITTMDPLEGAECSGVLIGPRLVLTAGHCVCKPLGASSLNEGESTPGNGRSCAKQAHAVTVVYGKARGKVIADFKLRIYTGSVRPHPELKLTAGEDGALSAASADLAVIVLNEPVEDGIPVAALADTEVQIDEPLLMAGYGQDPSIGGIYGARYFRRNKVTGADVTSTGRFIYEQQGPYLYSGFSGGPCFRESDGSYWLAGISSTGSDRELSFTSTVSYRAWIRSEAQRALE
jgi:hypothetical protein